MTWKSRSFSLYFSLLPPYIAFYTYGTSRKAIVLVWAIRITANPLTEQTCCFKKSASNGLTSPSKVHMTSEEQQNYSSLTAIQKHTYAHREKDTTSPDYWAFFAKSDHLVPFCNHISQ